MELAKSNNQDDLNKAYNSGYCQWEMDSVYGGYIYTADGNTIPNN